MKAITVKDVINLKGIKKGDTIGFTKEAIRILNMPHNNPEGVVFDEIERLEVLDVHHTSVKLNKISDSKCWYNNGYVKKI